MVAAKWPRSAGLPPFVIAGLLLAGPAAVPAAVADEAASDAAYHYSTINALMQGLYDGDMTLGDLARHGDHGLGTINGLDGELVIIDGAPYQVRADGGASRLPESERTPFAVVARFEVDREVPLPAGLDMSGLEGLLDGAIGNPNFFQAIRIDGAFPSLALRSVPRQTPPYRPLADVVKAEQSTFELKDARGALIGFRSPNYAGGVTVPGYHFHFISDDRRHGGHVLNLTTGAGTIRIDEMAAFEVELPRSSAFRALDLGARRDAELDAVEKGRR